MKRTKTTLPTFFTPPPPALELLSVSQYANGAAKDKQEVVTSNEAWVAGAFDIDLDHYLELCVGDRRSRLLWRHLSLSEEVGGPFHSGCEWVVPPPSTCVVVWCMPGASKQKGSLSPTLR